MHSVELQVDTENRHIVDLTDRIVGFLREVEAADGLANVWTGHATAGLMVMETGSGSEDDLEALLDRLLPKDDRYVHRHGSRGHGADHLLPLFAGPSLTVPVLSGRLALGTWQRICLVDRNDDNPQRQVRVSLLPG
jgi:secondary thiamine-phosphate synthase enzyme